MSVLQVAGYITGIAAALVIIWQVLRWGNALVEGQRCILRSEMTRTYYRHKDEQKMRQYEYENFKDCYAAYKALNGNSFIAKINSEIDEWEVTS